MDEKLQERVSKEIRVLTKEIGMHENEVAILKNLVFRLLHDPKKYFKEIDENEI